MRPGNRLSQLLARALILALPSISQAGEVTLEVVDSEGAPLAHAVVALMPQYQYQPDFSQPRRATMDQHKLRFSPPVLAVRTNTQVRFLNSDPLFHHVYSFSPGKRFELGLKEGEASPPVLFDQPGRVVLGCNIHDGMLGYIYVLDTEWFGVSGSSGEVILTQIPPGDYELVVRHPRLEQPVSESLSLSREGSIKRRLRLPKLAPDPRRPGEEPNADPDLEPLLTR